MTSPPATLSYQIVNLVRKKISSEYVTASDTEVARAIGISRAAVSAYKAGRDVMSMQTLEQAQAILKLPPDELHDYAVMLSQEATPEAKAVWAAHQWMRERAKKFPSILLAGVVLVGLEKPISAEAHARSSEASAPCCVYYVKSRRKLFRWLKNKNGWPLPLAWTWARIRSMGSVPRSWSPSPVPT